MRSECSDRVNNSGRRKQERPSLQTSRKEEQDSRRTVKTKSVKQEVRSVIEPKVNSVVSVLSIFYNE
jgi:hypothetical protein